MPENVHLYRAAVLAWRKAETKEVLRHDGNHKLVNPDVADHAAALAVKALAPGMTHEQAFERARQATNWCAQAHNKWFWSVIPGSPY